MKKTKKIKLKNEKNYAGFLMAEAVIAIFIAGTVLTVFFSVMSKMFLSAYTQRDYVIAENLAQEGIEMVRNLRDNELKEKHKAFGKEPLNCNLVGGCVCQTGNNKPCEPIGSFPSSGGKFTRTITVFPDDDDDSKEVVVSKVDWTIPGSTSVKTSQVEATLYNWGQK